MTFDGPGQQSTLVEHHLSSRSDWEAVLTPVVDTLLTRPDVESARTAVIGVGQAGYCVSRALAFEHRLAAAVVDPGVIDVGTSWRVALSPTMRARLDDDDREAFDREMRLAELFSPAMSAMLRSWGEPYGRGNDSRFELYRAVSRYRLGQELMDIKTPLLITEAEGEQFWPGQSRRLYDILPGVKQLASFSADDGAGRHCEPLGSAHRETRIFDWLENYLQPADAPAVGHDSEAFAVAAPARLR